MLRSKVVIELVPDNYSGEISIKVVMDRFNGQSESSILLKDRPSIEEIMGRTEELVADLDQKDLPF